MAVAVTLATPEALVIAEELDNMALAPLAGAAKVTLMPLTGLPFVSFTVTCRAFAKAALNSVDCGVPPVAVTLPTPVLVSGKFAANVPKVAVTV